jgi:Fe-coproporphyrin III synthase
LEDKGSQLLDGLLQDWGKAEPPDLRQVEIHGAGALEAADLPRFCSFLRERGVEITFHCTNLGNGALNTIAGCFRRVIIHLAGSASVHDRIRQSPGSAARLAESIAQLKDRNGGLEIAGRIIVEKMNCDNLPEAVHFSRSIGVQSVAFGHAELRYEKEDRPTALSLSDLPRLSRSIESLLGRFGCDFSSGFIATAPARLWQIYRYFKTFAGAGHLSTARCRVPWFSCSIGSDGSVFACPRHRAVGDLRRDSLHQIMDGPCVDDFRRELDVSQDPVCASCIDYKTKP